MTKSSSLLAVLRGWRREPAKKKKQQQKRKVAAILSVRVRKRVSLLDCKIGGRLRSRSLTKGTYLLLVSAWPALALEFYYLPGTSLLNPALGYGRQTASAPALQPESDGDVTQWGKKEKKKKKEREREREGRRGGKEVLYP